MGATLAIIYLFPYITRAIPSTLVAIVSITALVIFMDINLRTVGDMGAISQTLPTLFIPEVPKNILRDRRIVFCICYGTSNEI